jgi:hypothetical protein
MRPDSYQHNIHRPATWRMVLVLLAVLATGAQQLVAATHWHASAAMASDAGAGSTDGDTGKQHDCLWCHVAAHASAAPPPAVQQAPAAPETFLVLVEAERSFSFVPAPAHAWQSRGPPTI